MTAASAGHPLDGLVRSFEQSNYRERVLEQVFCAELMQSAWVAGYGPVELSRGFVDANGYDLIVECGEVIRHVQLKATRGGITLHLDLERKPSACCVLLLPVVVGGRIELRYRYFGSDAGQSLELSEFVKAKKVHWVKQNGVLVKPERSHHVVVPRGAFAAPRPIEELLLPLLGQPTSPYDPAAAST